MRHLILIILLTSFVLNTYSQRKCGTAEALAEKLQQFPALARKWQDVEVQLQRKRPDNRLQRVHNRVTIPVVVHIVLQDPSLVTEAQVLAQLEKVNLDYIAQNTDVNSVPLVWQALTGNAEIEFCLAARTPDNDPTNGIVRKTTSRISFPPESGVSAVKYTVSGGSPAWDPSRYLNIWVCDIQNAYLGFATPPGNFYPFEEEGVVVDYQAFGSGGSAQAPFNLGRTLTHEIGHFFGLQHTWGDDNGTCNSDDGVGDTPLQGDRNYDCPTFPRVDNCTPAAPGVMFMNFMDYVNDNCMYFFTTGQADRMRNALEGQRTSLLTSNGCTPVNLQQNDAGISKINTPEGYRCATGQTPVVTLKNRGANVLTGVTIRYNVNNGAPVTYAWTGNLTSMQETSVTLPSFTAAEGISSITAYTRQPNGMADDQTANDTATASFSYYTELSIPYAESFDNTVFPPTAWSLRNPDLSFTWEQANTGSKGTPHSAVMRNLGYAVNGQADDLLSPVLNSGNADSVFLFFDVAAAVASPLNAASTNPWDTLEVLITTDCGQTFIPTGYKKWGSTLATRRTPTAEEFIPLASEWRTDSVDLTSFVKQQPFRVVFRNTSNYENNVYIDQVNIVSRNVNADLKADGILLWPSPFSRQFYLEFTTWPEDLSGISVHNVSGRAIWQQQPIVRSGNRVTIDLVNEANGVYFVKLFFKQQQAKTYKIVKVQ